MDKHIKEAYEYALLDVLSFLYDIGGCDAHDEWSSGYDKAIDEIESAILDLDVDGDLENKYDELMDNKIDGTARENIALDNSQINMYKKGIEDILVILKKIDYCKDNDDRSNGFNEAFHNVYEKVIELSNAT